jgi:hypothetical protein
MPTYRAYLLTPMGKITRGEWIQAADQAEAEAKAQALCDPGVPRVELWLGSKRVAELPCLERQKTARPLP